MIRRPPRSTQSRSSAASDVYKRQVLDIPTPEMTEAVPDHLVVLLQKDAPNLIAIGSRSFRRVDDVGEQDSRENPLGSWQSLSSRAKRRTVIVHILIGMSKIV